MVERVLGDIGNTQVGVASYSALLRLELSCQDLDEGRLAGT
jgi:hypothetical protein